MDIKPKILIVDDEPALVRLMEMYLARLGYLVKAFTSATAALEEFEAEPAQYGVLIADLTMPEMPGDVMAQTMAAANTALRVIICSGYPCDLETLPESMRARFACVQKPFVPTVLARAVEELLTRQIGSSEGVS